MKFTVVLSLVAVLALSACAQGVTYCNDRTAGKCTESKSVKGSKADSAFSKSLHK